MAIVGRLISTRDPVPENRDPVPLPRARSVLLMRVVRPLCVKCGHGTFRLGNSARPNYTTGEMTRYKTCAHCGQKYMFVNDPTPEEAERYWGGKELP